MAITFDSPMNLNSIIKVIGVGGGGGNAVNHMHTQGIIGVNFIICNTDEQALLQSAIPNKVQLGPDLTEGRGAGSQPEIGKNATIESIDQIKQILGANTRMVFITAGMGGGTGTGGAPIIAKAARELGILTVGIVTTPFAFEGKKRLTQAQKGIEEMKQNVDAIIVISNDKVRELHGNLALSAAFSKADDVLTTAAKGIAEIITVPGYVNVDFEDVNTVIKNSGVALMGTGIADGTDRALRAVKMALSSPLLNDNDIRGAKNILLSISSGSKEVLMDEISDITNYIQEATGYNATEVIWGTNHDTNLEEKISVTVIATGFESNQQARKTEISIQPNTARKTENRTVLNLEDSIHHDNKTDFTTKKNTNTHNFPPLEINDQANDNYTNNASRFNNTNTFNQEEYDQEQQERTVEERRRRLQGLNLKINPQNINEIEKEPAYKRRNINFDETPHSSQSNISRYTLSENDKQQIDLKRNNPYLNNQLD